MLDCFDAKIKMPNVKEDHASVGAEVAGTAQDDVLLLLEREPSGGVWRHGDL